MLKLTNVKKIYTTKAGDVAALDGINLVFPDSGLVFIVGASGSGKTTLLNAIGGLDGINEGEININGRSFSSLDAKEYDSYRNTFIGFVFQEYNLLPDYTIRQNIEMANELQGKKTSEEEFENLLNLVGLSGYGQRLPSELSGGQKQRVAIARALLKNPQILMADEPTGALDSVTGVQIMEILKELSKTKLVVVVSHDLELAEKYADRIIRLKDGLVIEDFEIKDVKIDGNCYVGDKSISILEGASLNEQETKQLVQAIKDRKKVEFTDVVSIKEKQVTKVDLDKEYDGEQVQLINSKMKIKRAVSMGLKSLKVKPLRLFFTILLSVVAFAVFGIFDTVASYNRAVLISNTLRESEASTLVTSVDYNADIVGSYKVKIGQEDVDKINQRTGFNFKGVFDLTGKNEDSNVAELQNVTTFTRGKSYYVNTISGALEISNSDIEGDVIKGYGYKILHKKDGFDFTVKYDENGQLSHDVGVSSYFIEVIKKFKTPNHTGDYGTGGFAFGGKKVTKDADFIGATFNTGHTSEIQTWTIAAIIDCGEIPTKFDSLKGAYNGKEDASLLSEFKTYISAGAYNCLFVGENFAEEYSKHYNRGNPYVTSGFSFKVSSKEMEKAEKVSDYFYNFKDESDGNRVIFFDSTRNTAANKTLGNNEVIIGIDKDVNNLSKVFLKEIGSLIPTEKKDVETLLADLGKESLVIPEEYWHLPEDQQLYALKKDMITNFFNAISYEPTDYKSITVQKVLQDAEIIRECELEVVGVYFNVNCSIYPRTWRPFMVNDTILERFDVYQNQGYYSKLISPINRGNTKGVADLMTTESGISLKWHNNEALEMLSLNHSTIQNFFNLFLYVALVLAIFSMFMLFNYMSTSISAKRQSIGILRALGSSGKNVFIMFIVESLIIAIINAMFACLVTAIGCIFVNQYIINVMMIPLTFATFGIRQAVILFGISISTAIISSVLPIIKISKQKPVELIRKV